MGDEPEKSEASTAGTEEGTDASKAESGAAPGADAGSAKTKVILLAVLACIIAAVVVVFLVAGSGGKAKSTTPGRSGGGGGGGGGGGKGGGNTTAASVPAGEAANETMSMSMSMTTTAGGGEMNDIPPMVKACVVSCSDYAMLTCTEIIHMVQDATMTMKELMPLKAAAMAATDDSKRYYAAIGFDDYMMHKAEFLPHIAGIGAGILHIPADKINKAQAAMKELKDNKAMKIILGFIYSNDLRVMTNENIKNIEKAMKGADLFILETHTMKGMMPSTPCKVLPPSIWLTSRAHIHGSGLNFVHANKLLKGLISSGARLSVSATVAVFKYTSATPFVTPDVYGGECTEGMMMESFDAGMCMEAILDVADCSAIVANHDKKIIYLYEDKETLQTKIMQANEDIGDVGWTLFGSVCMDKSVHGCPQRPADPFAVQQIERWSPQTPPMPGPKPSGKSLRLFCVLGPCTTDMDHALVTPCTDLIYYDPEMTGISAPDAADKTYSMFSKHAHHKMYFMGFKGATFTTAMAGTPAPDFSAFSSLAGIAVLDYDSSPQSDIFMKLKTMMAGKTFIFGIMYAAGLDLHMLGSDVMIILQTHMIGTSPAGSCTPHPTTLWMQGGPAGMLLTDAVDMAKTTGEMRTALSISLMGIKFEYGTPPATADEALTAACTKEEAYTLQDADCAGTMDTNNNDAVTINSSMAILYESEATAAKKKMMYMGSWAVFGVPCAAQSSCKTAEIISALAPAASPPP